MNIKTRTGEQLFLEWHFSPSAEPGFDSVIMSIMLVIGNGDLEAGAVSVRVHGKGNLRAKKKEEAIAEILLSIKERRAS